MEDRRAEDKNPIQVAGRLFGALEYLTEHGSAGLMEIAEALGLNKSTTHRVVSSLQYMDYVHQDPETGKYEPTFKVVDLSERIMSRIDVIEVVRPYLRKLMLATEETVHFVQRDGIDCVYIAKMESNANTVRMVSHIGSRIPFYRSAVGKAIAAELTTDEVKAMWDKCTIRRMTPYTITNFDDFCDSLEEVRRKGYALDNEENETGVRCIGICVKTTRHRTRYALSISVPISRMDNDRIRELSVHIQQAKDEIEKALGV